MQGLGGVWVGIAPLEDRMKAAEEMQAAGTSGKWYYAAPILLFWIVIIVAVLKEVFKIETEIERKENSC